MKQHKALTVCPVCNYGMTITRLSCGSCHTTIEGNFMFSKFNYLDEEKLYFIEIFMKNRGNIKLIEKELNLSYPTVKKMLDETVSALGYNVTPEEDANVSDVLDLVKSGDLTVAEALLKIKK